MRTAFMLVMVLLALGAAEMAMRYLNWPPPVISGWRTNLPDGPLNQYGWRGQPVSPHQPNDYVVVLTGAADVECLSCPPDETLDLMLERALRRYNPSARVVTLGSTGYGQDQEYLALHEYLAHDRADLVVTWMSVADDVPANTFRSGRPRPGLTALKPSFTLRGDELRGPTEPLGQAVYKSKLSTLVWPLLIDVDRNWTTLLPPADPGADHPPQGVEVRSDVDAPLEQQRSSWSIWLTPRPARVQYGIDLTRALLTHMRELATLRGARFAVLVTPAASGTTAPVALEHDGHWFLADPATRDAAIAEVTEGFDRITLPSEDGKPGSPETERPIMARLAAALNQRDMLLSAAATASRR